MTDFPLLTIEQEVKTRGSRERDSRVKTRRFSTTLLGWVGADSLWDCGSTAKSTRPIWLAYTGSESAVRAFGDNLRGGHRAAMRVPGPRRYGYDSDIFQLPKRSGHRWVHQRFGDTAVTVAYLPDLFHLEPDFVGEIGRIDFVCMPPTWWLDAQTVSLRPDDSVWADSASLKLLQRVSLMGSEWGEVEGIPVDLPIFHQTRRG